MFRFGPHHDARQLPFELHIGELFVDRRLRRDGVGGYNLHPGEPDRFGHCIIALKKLFHLLAPVISITFLGQLVAQMPQPLQ